MVKHQPINPLDPKIMSLAEFAGWQIAMIAAAANGAGMLVILPLATFGFWACLGKIYKAWL